MVGLAESAGPFTMVADDTSPSIALSNEGGIGIGVDIPTIHCHRTRVTEKTKPS